MQKEWKGKTMDEVATQPAPEWLIEGVLPEHGTSLLYGKSGVGKSFVGADVAYAVFTGQSWHGHAVTQGGVVYVATEGIDGLGMRFSALRQRAGNPPEAPSTVVPGEVNLLDAEEVDSFVAYVRDLGGVRLVVLDTLNRCMPGVADENSNAAMSQAVRGAERIAEGTDAHVLIVHHTGKNGMSARGGYALECNTDARFRIGTPNTPALAPGGILTLYNEKQRNTGNTPRIELKAELMSLPDGSTTLVLSDVLGKTRTPRRKDTKKQVLAYHAQGKTNAWIADKLDVKAGTVSSIISRDNNPMRRHLRAVS